MPVRYLVFICFLTALASACFDPKKGCLDIEASNFDANADKNCCCTYPVLEIAVNHAYDTILYLDKIVYKNEFGYFRPYSVVFYLYDFQLRQNGTWNEISDTIPLYCFGPNPGDSIKQTLKNDFALLRRTALTLKPGTFRNTGVFDGFRLQLGLSPKANQAIPSKAPSNHPLFTQSENLWISKNEGYVFARIVVAPDSLANTPPDTFTYLAGDIPKRMFEQTGILLNHQAGYNFKLNLKIDYKTLFQNVNWLAPLAQRKVTIGDNLPNVFSVSQ